MPSDLFPLFRLAPILEAIAVGTFAPEGHHKAYCV